MSVLMTKSGQTVALPATGGALTLGAGPDCQILCTDRGFLLRDLAGPNGTFVNGQRVRERMLQENDVIQIGADHYTFMAGQRPNGSGGQATTRSVPRPTTARVQPHAAHPQKPATSRIPMAAAPPAAPAPAAQPTTARTKPITQRIAVPAAQPQQKTGTQRIATAAHQKPGTQRIATQATPSGGQQKTGTQRINNPATGATARTTGRMSAGTTRSTGRSTTRRTTTGRAMVTNRYQKSGGFSLPKTRKGWTILGCVVGGLLAIFVVMMIIKMGQVDPEKVRKECEEAVNKCLQETDISKQEKLADEIHENPLYRVHGGEIFVKFEKVYYQGIKDRAKLEKEARKEAGRFIEEYKKVHAEAKEFSRRAGEFRERARDLRQKYGGTTLGPELDKVEEESAKEVDSQMTLVPGEVELTRNKASILDLAKSGDLVKAFERLDELARKYGAESDERFRKKVQDFREDLTRAGDRYVAELCRKVDQLLAQGNKEEAKKALSDALPGVTGQNLPSKWAASIKAKQGEIK